MWSLAEKAPVIVTVTGVLNDSTVVAAVVTVTVGVGVTVAVDLAAAVSVSLAVDVVVPAAVAVSSSFLAVSTLLHPRPYQRPLVFSRLTTSNS